MEKPDVQLEGALKELAPDKVSDYLGRYHALRNELTRIVSTQLFEESEDNKGVEDAAANVENARDYLVQNFDNPSVDKQKLIEDFSRELGFIDEYLASMPMFRHDPEKSKESRTELENYYEKEFYGMLEKLKQVLGDKIRLDKLDRFVQSFLSSSLREKCNAISKSQGSSRKEQIKAVQRGVGEDLKAILRNDDLFSDVSFDERMKYFTSEKLREYGLDELISW